MVALKHLICVKSRSLAMLFWESLMFEKVDERITETALVAVSNVYYSLLLRETLWERLPTASFERGVLYHL